MRISILDATLLERVLIYSPFWGHGFFFLKEQEGYLAPTENIKLIKKKESDMETPK